MSYINKYTSYMSRWIVIILAFLVLTSCESFLSQRPSKTSDRTVETAKDLDLLLNDYFTFIEEPNYTAVYSTDDYGMFPALYDARPGTFFFPGILYTFWDTENIDGGRDSYWSGEFEKIFVANLVLNSLGEVTGSDELKARLRAEAHFIRAYSYWGLAQTYCLPYTEANADEPGLPIKTSTSFEEPLDRGTLEELYQFIESDLKEALKITTPLVQDGMPVIWRANTAAVNGFAARYYLQQHNYTEALKYANAALDEYNVLRDYNTEMSYGQLQQVTLDPGTPQQTSYTIEYPYTHDHRIIIGDLTAAVEWGGMLYARFLMHGSWWYIPSQELLSLYDKDNDLRYKYHIVEGFSYDRGLTNPSYAYPGYIFFFKDAIPSGPTTAEMYLVKAECLARTGQVGPAMTTLNQLYSMRVHPGTPALTASGQAEAIKVVLEERRRELAFSHRWWDIRRLNTNDYPADDIVLEKTFYPYDGSTVLMDQAPVTYTLEKNSRRYAAPIPLTEITSSQGAIEQNTY